jgi:hypothetical protein
MKNKSLAFTGVPKTVEQSNKERSEKVNENLRSFFVDEIEVRRRKLTPSKFIPQR